MLAVVINEEILKMRRRSALAQGIQLHACSMWHKNKSLHWSSQHFQQDVFRNDFLCVWVLACIYVCATCVRDALAGQKRALDALKLELEML